jgi:hypothetical protein
MAIVPLLKGRQNKDPKTFLIEFKIVCIFETIGWCVNAKTINAIPFRIVEREKINMIKRLHVKQKRTSESIFKMFA